MSPDEKLRELYHKYFSNWYEGYSPEPHADGMARAFAKWVLEEAERRCWKQDWRIVLTEFASKLEEK